MIHTRVQLVNLKFNLTPLICRMLICLTSYDRLKEVLKITNTYGATSAPLKKED